MGRERLDVFISEDIRDYIVATAQQEGKHLYLVTEELLRVGIMQKEGKVIEHEFLPAVREVVQGEMLKAMSAMRLAVREDMRTIIVPGVQEHSTKGVDKLARLLVRTLRDVGIIRRQVYSLLANAVGVDGAQKLYRDAQEKAIQEMSKQIAEAGGDA
jgi:uncharacterized protein YjiS (DUF1127 family)